MKQCISLPGVGRVRVCAGVCQHPCLHTLHTFSAYFSTVAPRHSASTCTIMQRAHFAYFAYIFPHSVGVVVGVYCIHSRALFFFLINVCQKV